MKKLSTALAFAVGMAYSQPYYFWTGTDAYTPLSSGTSVNAGTVWSGFDVFPVPIGFSFDFMDQSFTAFDFEVTGRVIFDVGHYYFADMFVVNGMQDKGTVTSLSPIEYELTGTAGTQIFKLQVSNATYAGDLTSTINFQIWLYEETSRVELHMGPNDIPDPSAAFPAGVPSSGVFHVVDWSPLDYGYGLMAHGNPANPEDSAFSGTTVSTWGITLDDCPAEDMVYVYGDYASIVSTDAITMAEIAVYPNPATSFIRMTGVQGPVNFQLSDLTGKCLLSGRTGETAQCDVSSLIPGLYVLKLDVESETMRTLVRIGE